MRRAIVLSSFAVLFMALAPIRAEACSCMPSGPPCSETWESPVVFSGTVTDVVLASKDQPRGRRIVKFAITESFRGVEAAEISLTLEGTSCDLEFEAGEAWLVYARNRGGLPGWTTSMCSRTRLLSLAAEDLAYLRLPDEQKPPSHITGRVQQQLVDHATGRYQSQNKPVSGVPVVVTGNSMRQEATTDHEGRYSIRVSPYRVYAIEFGKIEGLVISSYASSVWVPHHLACRGVDAYAIYDGRVAGQLVDTLGRPVPFFPITLAASPPISMGGFEKHTFTDASGQFEFTGVQPAAYLISPSTSLWQKAQALPALTAFPVQVPPAGRVEAGRLRLPASAKTTLVEIVLEGSDGKPAAGATVTVTQPDSYHAIYPDSRMPTDSSGTFRVSLIAGRRYTIQAGHSRQTAEGIISETAEAVIEATGLKPIRLRLARSR